MSKSTGTATASAESPAYVENVKALFGSHPEDVIRPIKTAADVLGWLEEILQTIVQEVGRGRNNSVRLKSLAEAGAYLAADFCNLVGCEHERLLEALRQAGVVDVKTGNGHD